MFLAVILTQAPTTGRASRSEPSALVASVQVTKSVLYAMGMLATLLPVAKAYQVLLTLMMLGSGKLTGRTGPDTEGVGKGLEVEVEV